MLTLDVLIATHQPAGIERVARMQLPVVEGVRYIVSWQEHGDAPVPPALAERDDVEVYRFDRQGVSLNRNNAIAHSRGDVMLMGDDDLRYTAEGLSAVAEAFEQMPSMDMAAFKSTGSGKACYPPADCSLMHLPKGYYATCFELVLRRDSRAGALRFDENFGPGSERWSVGEDGMLLLTARRKGLNIRFVAKEICHHPGPTTGRRPMTSADALGGEGALIALEHPVSAPARLLLKAWRAGRAANVPPIRLLAPLVRGAWWAYFKYRKPW